MVGPVIVTRSPDPFTRGLDYLYGVRSLAIEPDMIDVVHDLHHRIPVCTWIGCHIDAINAQLHAYRHACDACFHPGERPVIQLFAAPLAASFRLHGLCNLQTNPITILIDPGQVSPEHWLRLVVHEYAHAHGGIPGHQQQFARSLAHLCLGLGLTPPAYPPDYHPDIHPDIEDQLRVYPPVRRTQDPLTFWRGDADDWRSSVTNSYFLPQSIS